MSMPQTYNDHSTFCPCLCSEKSNTPSLSVEQGWELSQTPTTRSKENLNPAVGETITQNLGVKATAA
jgi:hypothetical protein